MWFQIVGSWALLDHFLMATIRWHASDMSAKHHSTLTCSCCAPISTIFSSPFISISFANQPLHFPLFPNPSLLTATFCQSPESLHHEPLQLALHQHCYAQTSPKVVDLIYIGLWHLFIISFLIGLCDSHVLTSVST